MNNDLDQYIQNLMNRARRYASIHHTPRRQPMKYLLSKVVPVHFQSSYNTVEGSTEITDWWQWRDRIYSHTVSS